MNKDEQFVGRSGTSTRPGVRHVHELGERLQQGHGDRGGCAIEEIVNEPALFVIKKNSGTLKNLLEWLKEHNARVGTSTVDAPMLLIDDEADNTSLTRSMARARYPGSTDRSVISSACSERSCSVGYTATPFANIFIDPDSDDEMLGADLFPRDFIVSLDPPTNYFGPGRMFIQEPEHFIRHVDDHDEFLPLRHRIDTQVTTLPASLETAIRTFVLARAIQLARGQVQQHCSMLVNASRFAECSDNCATRSTSFSRASKRVLASMALCPLTEHFWIRN